ncbi:MAG TPA: S8 family serine peptidase, partial [Gaiellaceae bacterium]|nr:S8 family serine peptidase [Gaiellaceae bacterium]
RGRAPAVVTVWSRADLAAVERAGVRGTRLRALPMVLTRSLTQEQLAALERSPAVRSVWANRANRLFMEDTTWITKARDVWESSAAGGFGVTGKDVHVAVIDTGADGMHEDLDNLVEFCDATVALTGTRASVVCSPFNPASGNAGPAGATGAARTDATDDDGHGTHVSGTVAGSGQASGGRGAAHSTIGMAPEAKLHVYSANVGPALLNHEILASYDDMVFKKVNGISRVVAVNNSWGGGGGANYDPNDPVHVAVKAAYDAGILSVFAAGNSGPEHNTLSRQCVSPWVVCVAASTKPDSIVMFSSRGRPAEPADTNRDGTVGGAGDAATGNHDRALGQAFEIGLYRPTLAAPGVNINSASANAATCREGGAAPDSGCYEMLNGTSMATPHVTGAVALIVEAYRQGHGGATPTPAIITDILERSAALNKLPGYEAEEQGAGRLDVFDAVGFAKTYPNGLPRPVFGTPSPPYAAGKHPGAPGTQYTEKGCTGTLSWTLPGVPNPLDVDSPPVATERYAQHEIDVPARTERLRITIDWSRHPGANLYLRLWRPGVDPNQDTASPGQVRVWPDQEAVGLLNPNNTPFIGPTRWLDVRAAEEATLEEGRWILRVYHRAGGSPSACDGDSKERPKQTEGFNYTLKIELPQAAEAPSVAITSPAAGSTVTGRYVSVAGTASYPTPWNGVTSWEVAGTGNPSALPPGPDTRTVLHFQGNVEEGCTGAGAADIVTCNGPFLRPAAALSGSPAASWTAPTPLVNGTAARTIYDPNWVWNLTSQTTLAGPMTVEFWASCGGCARSLGLSADWVVRLWADGVRAFEQRVTATPSAPNVAEKLSVTVNLPPITASSSIVLHLDPVYVDTQEGTRIYYDSAQACPTASGSEPCDSLVRMPVGGAGGGSGPGIPAQVRVTDRHDALIVAWAPVAGATGYEIHRSTSPSFVPSEATLVATTAGTACQSPDVPSWPGASRPGLCYTDAGVGAGTTYYYRVVAVQGEARSAASLLAYGTPSAYDRQVKVKVDRLYGPQYWEYATLAGPAGTSWSYVWDTLELAPGEHRVGARSVTQGIGSAKASFLVNKEEAGGQGERVRFCHATGNPDRPYVESTGTKAAIAHGHFGSEHQGGRDIIPPFEYRGRTYSQNWPQGKPILDNGCRTS